MFLKGAEVPGEDAEATDGEEEAQDFPMGQWPWLSIFLRIFWRAFSMGSAVEEGRKPVLNLPMVIVVVPQLGTLTGVSFWWPAT